MAKGVKTGGRVAGTPNKATTEFRQTITALLQKNAKNVDRWLQQVADGRGDSKPDPAKALDLLAKLAEFGAPKLNRSEISGPNGGPIESQNKTTLDVSSLTPDQIRALASIRLNGE